jgi:hypothetical protein
MDEETTNQKASSSRIAIVALVVAILSAMLSGFQAYDSHRVAEATLKVAAIDHRPQITVSLVSLSRSSDGKQFTLSVLFTNDGVLNADNFKGSINAFVNGRLIGVKNNDQLMNLGRAVHLTWEMAVTLSDEQATAVAAGAAQLRFVVVATYASSYDPEPKQEGTCFAYNPRDTPGKADYCDVLALFSHPTQPVP